jgi:hypothetical protein
VVIPGLGNKLLSWAVPFVPRALLLPAVRYLQSGGT